MSNLKKLPTFCVMVGGNLTQSQCPLPHGECYWQHRRTNECSFTEQDLTVDEFKVLVGSTDPVTDLDEFRDRLRLAL